MGHYDDAYEDSYAEQRRQRQQRLAELYVKAQPNLQEVRRFITNFRGSAELQSAFHTFEAHLIHQLYIENVLTIKPEIVLNKLEK